MVCNGEKTNDEFGNRIDFKTVLVPYEADPSWIPDKIKEMKKVLGEIQSGAFAKEWMAQAREGSPFLNEKREEASKHQIEEIGKSLRNMMPFLDAKDVAKDK